jgi:cytochrome b6-f complex iron-sulfur subunit
LTSPVSDPSKINSFEIRLYRKLIQTEPVNRKEFLKTTALALAGVALGPAFLESCSKGNATPQGPSVNFTVDLNASANAALKDVGGYIYSNGVIIARISTLDLGFIALAQKCTHSGCNIAYNSSSQTFICPCHNGTFDLNGNVISGPPQSPVLKYSITRNNNILTIQG